MVAKKKKLKVIKNKTEINKPKVKRVEIVSPKTPEKNKQYFEYYSIVIFLIFCVLFISVLIIFVFALFGAKYLWSVIPVTLVLWLISYLLAKRIFKKSQKK